MNTNMIDIIVKPEKTTNKSDKSFETLPLFTFVSHVALTKKIIKNKTEISSVLPIFALLVRSHGTNDMIDCDPLYGQYKGGCGGCSHIATNPGSAEHTRLR